MIRNEELAKNKVFIPPEYKFEMIPLEWLQPSTALSLGYEKHYNFKRAIIHIENNKPFIDFATANITSLKPEFRNLTSLKLLGPILRLRIALIGIILTALSHIPILAASLCLAIELFYFTLISVSILRYKYFQNWVVTVSRVNVNISLISMNVIGLYLAVDQAGSPNYQLNMVKSYIQMLGVISILFCVFVELVFLILYMLYSMFKWSRKACSESKKLEGNVSE